jgi:hypothetical protein
MEIMDELVLGIVMWGEFNWCFGVCEFRIDINQVVYIVSLG